MVHWIRVALIIAGVSAVASANGFLLFFCAGFHV